MAVSLFPALRTALLGGIVQRHFDSRAGAELWLDREGIAGQPVLLQTYTDERGR